MLELTDRLERFYGPLPLPPEDPFALYVWEVLGIRTTIPFFLWLMQQPDYKDGRYDTTYLDRLLADRRGESFSAPDAADVDLVTIAAALDAYFKASAGPTRSSRQAGSLWRQTGRREALRG